MNTNANALVLAAHGSHTDPECNAQVHRWAQALKKCLPFDEVHAAFHKGSPVFAEVLDRIEATNVTVIPVMTSAGYYATKVLPCELAKNYSYPDKRIRLTPPLGTHPAIVEMVRRRVRILANDFAFNPIQATLAIVGHGTTRHPTSRLATLELADKLRANKAAGTEAARTEAARTEAARTEATRTTEIPGQVLATFLDDEPRIAKVLKAAEGDPVVVVPFFIGVGTHPLRDASAACGSTYVGKNAWALPREKPRKEPREEIIAGRRFIFDRPMGCDEGVTEILADLARESLTIKSLAREVSPQHAPPSQHARPPQHAHPKQACHGTTAP